MHTSQRLKLRPPKLIPIDRRKLVGPLEKKVNNWRIVAGVLALVAVYGWTGERDREAYSALQRPVMTGQHKMIGGRV